MLSIQDIEIAEGDAGIYQTTYLMCKQAAIGAMQPEVRELVQALIKGHEGKLRETQSQIITRWVAENITYTEDDWVSYTEKGMQEINVQDCPQHFGHCESVEMILTPVETLKQRRGDCDDVSTLLRAMHKVIGIEGRFVVAAADPSQPTEFSHVYLIVNIGDRWIPIDAINKQKPWGWQIENPFRREVVC